MNPVKVLHGNPSQEELAAVLTVLLSVGQHPAPGAHDSRPALREASWSRGGRAYPAPAGSWRFPS
ncbi:acyl-CoA carboxylase subunit epsilon [Streptomyces galbus]|uniref:Acyl-CoA carboxylase subunit epsilon n=1 Tax=Streptomyces galbus TaxID=33898 RepID=A0ABX1IN98_STRGB|nr:acyl-CoA carboxylase subunit epsilon [Streptomyces galbus]NKQ27099.1 acyl-CoA carboxylase subunit epsilon [Streptomyces galbus]